MYGLMPSLPIGVKHQKKNQSPIGVVDMYRNFAKELLTLCGFILEPLAPPQISMVTMILLKQTNKQSINTSVCILTIILLPWIHTHHKC